jgi:hypothetical protein
MNGTNKQPRVLAWLRRIMRTPWAPLSKEAERECQRAANAGMQKRG